VEYEIIQEVNISKLLDPSLYLIEHFCIVEAVTLILI